MKKDWVIWVGCISLFGAGAIWGATLNGIKYFQIKDIHDLAETLAGFATVIGVIVAVVGYNSWKAQSMAEADHQLSKKTLAAIRNYQPLAVDIFSMAKKLSEHMRTQLSYQESEKHWETVRLNLQLFKISHSEIYAAAFECKDFWDAEIWDKFDEVFSLTERCKTTVEYFILWSNKELPDQSRERIADMGVSAFDVVKMFVGSDKEEIEFYLKERFEVLICEVKKRRLV